MGDIHLKTWQDFEPERAAQISFQINVLEVELLSERLIRKCILAQYVDPNHPVLAKEIQLVAASLIKVRSHVQDLVGRGYDEQLVRMAVVRKVISSVRVIIQLHEVDEETAETAIGLAEREAMLIARLEKAIPS